MVDYLGVFGTWVMWVIVLLVAAPVALASGLLCYYLANLYRPDHRRKIREAGPPVISGLTLRAFEAELTATIAGNTADLQEQIGALRSELREVVEKHEELVRLVEELSLHPALAGDAR